MSLFTTLNGMTSSGGGLPTASLSFNGTTNYLQKTYANFGSITTSKVSIPFWVYRNSVTRFDGIFELGESPNRCIEILINNSDQMDIRTSKNGSAIDGRLVTNMTFSQSTWYQCLIDFTSSSLGLKVNGSTISSFATNTQPTGALYSTPDVVSWGLSAGQHMNGLIYQPAFVNNNNPNISNFYNGGHPMDIAPVTGLFSLLNTGVLPSLTQDFVNPVSWTNNNSVTTSATRPT